MNEPVISIGILSNREISFDLYGDFNTAVFIKKISGAFIAKLQDNKIEIEREGKETLSGDEIIFTPNEIETESFLLRDVVIGKSFHWERKENQRFRGTLKLVKDGNKITAVNIIPIEEYLSSVVSSEMSPNCSLELLKAHAIVSRGWLLAQLEKKEANSKSKSVNEFITEN